MLCVLRYTNVNTNCSSVLASYILNNKNIPSHLLFSFYQVVPILHCSGFSVKSIGGFLFSRVAISYTS